MLLLQQMVPQGTTPAVCVHSPYSFTGKVVILKRAHAFTGQRKSGLVFFTACFLALLVLEIWAFVVTAEGMLDVFATAGPFTKHVGK